MKKLFPLILCAVMLTSCATTIEATKEADMCQRCQPAKGEPHRKLRVGYVIADILSGVAISLLGHPELGYIFILGDAASGKLYKPCEPEKKTTAR